MHVPHLCVCMVNYGTCADFILGSRIAPSMFPVSLLFYKCVSFCVFVRNDDHNVTGAI